MIREQAGALDGAVGHDHVPHLLLLQMARAQLDHVAGADQEHGLFREVVEDLFRQPHRRGRDRHGAGADGGVGAHLLGDGEGLLEQAIEDLARDAGLVRLGERLLHLAEYLRLAQHHRIQPGGHAERVPHRVLVRVAVKIGVDVLAVQVVVVAEPLDDALVVGRFQPAVELGAVAGGQDRGLAGPAARGDLVQGVGQPVRRERRFFADRDRGGVVIDAEGKQVHGETKTSYRRGF